MWRRFRAQGSRIFRIVTLGLPAALAVAACTAPTAAPASSVAATVAVPAGPSGVVRVRVNGDWATLDPHLTRNAASLQILLTTNDRLVALGPSGDIVPYVAKSWKTSATETTFTLRNDVKCADGTPLTPTAVANSFSRWFALGKQSTTLVRHFGAGPYSATADDAAGTLTIKLGTPFNELVTSLSTGYGSIICPAGLANPSALENGSYGSGPYTIASAAHGDSITLNARPDWTWGPQGASAKSSGFPAQIIYQVVANETTAANQLLTGGLNLGFVTGRDVQRLTSEKALIKKQAESFTAQLMEFNQDSGHPTADLAVRDALATAIDPKAYNVAAAAGDYTVSTSIFSPKMPCYDAGTAKVVPTPDATKARSILASAGYKAGTDGKLSKDGKPLAIRVLATLNIGPGAEYLAEQFRSIGVTTTLSQVELGEYSRLGQAGDWDVQVALAETQIPAPSYFTSNLLPSLPSSRIHDEALGPQVLAAQAAAPNSAEQCQRWADVQERFITNRDFLPLIIGKYYWFAQGAQFEPGVLYVEPSYIRVSK